VEGCGKAKPPRIPLFLPAAAGQPGATPTALPPRAGTNRLVEGLRPSTPPRQKATAYLLLLRNSSALARAVGLRAV